MDAVKVTFKPPLKGKHTNVEIVSQIGSPKTCTVTMASGEKVTFDDVGVKTTVLKNGQSLVTVFTKTASAHKIEKPKAPDTLNGPTSSLSVTDEIEYFWKTASKESILQDLTAWKDQVKNASLLAQQAQQVGGALQGFGQKAVKAAESLTSLPVEATPPPVTVSPDLFATPEEDEAWAKQQEEEVPASDVKQAFAKGGIVSGGVPLSAKSLKLTKLGPTGEQIEAALGHLKSVAFEETPEEVLQNYSAADVALTKAMVGPASITADFTVDDPHVMHLVTGSKKLTCEKCYPPEPTDFDKAVEAHQSNLVLNPSFSGLKPWASSDALTYYLQKFYSQSPPVEKPKNHLIEDQGDGSYQMADPPTLCGAIGTPAPIPEEFSHPGTQGSNSKWWRFVYRTSYYAATEMHYKDAVEWAEFRPVMKIINAVLKKQQEEHPFDSVWGLDEVYKTMTPSLMFKVTTYKEVDPAGWVLEVTLPEISLEQIADYLGLK